MLSLEEISDRFEIQQLLVDYSTAIDTRRFDDLDHVFTPDAYIDYRAMGGIDGRFPEVKAWLAQVLPNFPAYATCSATSTSASTAIPRRRGPSASTRWCSAVSRTRSCSAGCGTIDEFVRTAEGWRMSRRVEEKCFDKVV